MWEYKQYHDKKENKLDRIILRLRDLQTLKMIKASVGCQAIIEVGPGRGTFGELCIERGIEYIAVEASSIGAERMRRQGLTVHETLFPDCGVLPEFGKKFDAFMARSVLEHMTGTVQANEFIKTAIKYIKPGGILFIEAPDIRFWKWAYWDSDYGHNYTCSLNRLRQLMQEYDLDILKLGTRSQFVCSPFDRIPYILSYLPIGKKMITSFLPNAYVIARV